jgi:hypothetical protein
VRLKREHSSFDRAGNDRQNNSCRHVRYSLEFVTLCLIGLTHYANRFE